MLQYLFSAYKNTASSYIVIRLIYTQGLVLNFGQDFLIGSVSYKLSLPAYDDVCHVLITMEKSLDPNMDPNCLTLCR